MAKQAAEVDLLTQGQFRFGSDFGRNAVKYDALGQDFATSGGASTSRFGCCAGCGPNRA